MKILPYNDPDDAPSGPAGMPPELEKEMKSNPFIKFLIDNIYWPDLRPSQTAGRWNAIISNRSFDVLAYPEDGLNFDASLFPVGSTVDFVFPASRLDGYLDFVIMARVQNIFEFCFAFTNETNFYKPVLNPAYFLKIMTEQIKSSAFTGGEIQVIDEEGHMNATYMIDVPATGNMAELYMNLYKDFENIYTKAKMQLAKEAKELNSTDQKAELNADDTD